MLQRLFPAGKICKTGSFVGPHRSEKQQPRTPQFKNRHARWCIYRSREKNSYKASTLLAMTTHERSTGSMSTANETSSGNAIDSSNSASFLLIHVICRARSMI